MGNKNLTAVCERVAKLETNDDSNKKKIDEIHKALVGNGQPGLLAEFNQWKGGAKLFRIAISVLSVLVGLVSLAAYLR